MHIRILSGTQFTLVLCIRGSDTVLPSITLCLPSPDPACSPITYSIGSADINWNTLLTAAHGLPPGCSVASVAPEYVLVNSGAGIEEVVTMELSVYLDMQATPARQFPAARPTCSTK
jgi:hypothetical protein